MFNSSNQYGYAAIATPDFIEAAWVPADATTAGQSITANTLTTLNLTTLVQNTLGAGVSVGSNQLTLPAGTYSFEVESQQSANAGIGEFILSLYNVSDSVHISRTHKQSVGSTGAPIGETAKLKGQFTINASKVFEIRFLSATAAIIGKVDSGAYQISLATAGLDQRTTIKLWRYKDTFNTGTMYISGGSGGYTSYAEYGWVCAPNAAGQSISANTLTTCTIDTEVSDVDNIGSVGSNQVTLTSGTYYFELYVPVIDTAGVYSSHIIALRKDPSGSPSWITRKVVSGYANSIPEKYINGQFIINSSATFDITIQSIVSSGGIEIRSGYYNGTFTSSTAGTDQRTTLKVWKK